MYISKIRSINRVTMTFAILLLLTLNGCDSSSTKASIVKPPIEDNSTQEQPPVIDDNTTQDTKKPAPIIVVSPSQIHIKKYSDSGAENVDINGEAITLSYRRVPNGRIAVEIPRENISNLVTIDLYAGTTRGVLRAIAADVKGDVYIPAEAGDYVISFIIANGVKPPLKVKLQVLVEGLATSTPKVEIYKNSFTSSPLGLYTTSQLDNEWNNPPSSQGVRDGRVSIVQDSSGDKAMQVLYPDGKYDPDRTGAQWKLLFGHSYNDLYSSYRIKFDKNFDFVKGGKLPGLAGGTAPSGGAEVTGHNGWSGRVMWRRDGMMVQYLYYPDKSGTYGEDFPWNRAITRGVWHTITNHFKMNTPGKRDGVMQAWLDGELVLDRRDIRFRDDTGFGIDLFYFSTFFGGSNSSWKTSKDETILFDDFIIYQQ